MRVQHAQVASETQHPANKSHYPRSWRRTWENHKNRVIFPKLSFDSGGRRERGRGVRRHIDEIDDDIERVSYLHKG